MQTVLGPFHPDLENALVDAISRHKKTDLLSPLLILVPSDLIRRRLKILLSRERGLALLGVQLLTFHQLSLRLNAECGGTPTELHSDLFLEEALRQIIRTGQPGAEPFAGIEDRAGGCAALWQTLRDLRDGLVDPVLALAALGEGHFSQRTGERTSQLLALMQTLQKFCAEQGIEDLSDLVRRAAEQAPASPFLQQFSEIFYYGFYDLTQIQLDFFRAVASRYPTKLFFPLLSVRPGHDAWSFAGRFYERYIQGHTDEPAGDSQLTSDAARQRPPVRQRQGSKIRETREEMALPDRQHIRHRGRSRHRGQRDPAVGRRRPIGVSRDRRGRARFGTLWHRDPKLLCPTSHTACRPA